MHISIVRQRSGACTDPGAICNKGAGCNGSVPRSGCSDLLSARHRTAGIRFNHPV